MTNIIVQIVLCLTAWVVVLVRFRGMHWEDARKDDAIALKVWLVMVWIAVGLTSMMDFATTLDAYTANNLSRFVSTSSILIAINLGLIAIIDAIGKPAVKLFVPWLWFLLLVTLVTSGSIYVLSLWQLPEFGYYTTIQSLSEALFKLVVYSFEVAQTLLASGIILAYLPSETSALMRTRLIIILFSFLVATGSSLAVVAAVAGYFWPNLVFPPLLNFSATLSIINIIIYIIALTSNKIYVQFVLLAQRIKKWYAFQDLQYLIERIMQIFPIIGLPPGNPNFFQFMGNPERYLYPAIILILDGRAMLDDFLAEVSDTATQREENKRENWQTEDEGDLLDKALEVQRALQSTRTPDDFYEMVDVYQRASREFLKSQTFPTS